MTSMSLGRRLSTPKMRFRDRSSQNVLRFHKLTDSDCLNRSLYVATSVIAPKHMSRHISEMAQLSILSSRAFGSERHR